MGDRDKMALIQAAREQLLNSKGMGAGETLEDGRDGVIEESADGVVEPDGLETVGLEDDSLDEAPDGVDDGDLEIDGLGDKGKVTIVKLRSEVKDLKRLLAEEQEKAEAFTNAIAEKLGLKIEPKSTEINTDSAMEAKLAEAEAKVRQAELEKIVAVNPGSGSPERLLRDVEFLRDLGKLDEDAGAREVKSLIKKYTDLYPHLRATPQAQVNLGGGQVKKPLSTREQKLAEARKSIGR